ncbi:MAG TPA: serine protease [Rhizomicrobium sp.]
MRIPIAAALTALQLAGSPGAAWSQADRDGDFIAAAGSIQRSIAPVMCLREMQPQLQPMPQQQIPPQRQSGGAPLGIASPQLQPLVAGTAFFLTRRGDFVTAASVIANFLPQGAFAGCTIMVWFAGPVDAAGNFSSQSFPVALNDCILDLSIDVARCRTVGDLAAVNGGRFAPEPVAVDDRQPDPGSSIGASGFILFDNEPIATRGHIGGYRPAQPNAMQMVIDRPASAWAGGSPIYDGHGRVLGMLVKVNNVILTDISVATTSLAISRFLTAHPLANK